MITSRRGDQNKIKSLLFASAGSLYLYHSPSLSLSRSLCFFLISFVLIEFDWPMNCRMNQFKHNLVSYKRWCLYLHLGGLQVCSTCTTNHSATFKLSFWATPCEDRVPIKVAGFKRYVFKLPYTTFVGSSGNLTAELMFLWFTTSLYNLTSKNNKASTILQLHLLGTFLC